MSPMRIVCLSDTHNHLDRIDVPDGDLLIHAGDFTGRGTQPEVERFAEVLAALPHAHKVVIAGNHDFMFELAPDEARDLLIDCTYLEDSGCEVGGLRIWGSPWQPWFHDWAFNLRGEDELAARWALIPDDTDVLITHGPPRGILDRTPDGEEVGCAELERAIRRVRPGLHVFGHIHEGYGLVERAGTIHVNACNCTLDYRPTNAPVSLDWDGAVFTVV